MAPGRDFWRSGVEEATGLVGEAPRAGTASCLPPGLWHGHLGHLGGVWVWGTAERRMAEGGFGVEGEEEEVAVCVVLAVVVGGGSSVGSLGERGVGEGGTGTEQAVGCVGSRQRWSLVTRLELRWCVRRLRVLPDTGSDSALPSRFPPWGTSPPRSITHHTRRCLFCTINGPHTGYEPTA